MNSSRRTSFLDNIIRNYKSNKLRLKRSFPAQISVTLWGVCVCVCMKLPGTIVGQFSGKTNEIIEYRS